MDLQSKDTSSAIAWCRLNKSKLKKINSDLEFKLLLQEYVELIRAGKTEEAIVHMQGFSKSFSKRNLEEIQRVMVCLVGYGRMKELPRYQPYFEESRWADLIRLFKEENFKIYSLAKAPLLCLILHSGITALKTNYCHSKDYQ